MAGFIIAGTQRAGTSLITSTLASHPGIHCLGEVFLFRKGRGKRIEGSYRQFIEQQYAVRHIAHYIKRQKLVEEYLDQLYGESGAELVGFKFMLDQSREFSEAMNYIQRNRIKVLHVIRENTLKILVSRISAKTRKLYHSAEDIAVDKIHLPTRSLIKNMDLIQQETAMWKRAAASNPYMAISYESFVADRESELQRALDFLGVDSTEVLCSSLKKINPDNLADVIENFTQVAEVLSGTQYEKYLGLSGPEQTTQA